MFALDVAERVFQHSDNFNRLFKKYKGMSPSQYRQRFR
ncbi:AraC family transcriptional regulator [Vibrio nigripulchritudo]|nr:AraC family transcriptional regulator [Vibrio nigripulchritudo]